MSKNLFLSLIGVLLGVLVCVVYGSSSFALLIIGCSIAFFVLSREKKILGSSTPLKKVKSNGRSGKKKKR